MPPLIGALVVGAVRRGLLGSFEPRRRRFGIWPPDRPRPSLVAGAMVELVVPLAITVLVVQNGQGIAVLTATGHQPPVNAITVACGLGSSCRRSSARSPPA